MTRAKNGSSTKIGVVWQKLDFWAKNRNFGPKKREPLLVIHHVLATTRKSCAKKKVPVSKINISLLKFSGIFCDKMHFWPKDHFSAKHKNIRFSIIPARIRSFVIVGHFLDDLDVSTKFCWKWSKIKGTYYSEVTQARKSQKTGWLSTEKDP